MPFYVADWSSSPDIRMMSFEERGVYFELLLVSWASDDGGLPASDDMLDRLLGQNGVWARVRSVVRRKFEERDGRLYNTRLCAELERSKGISEKRVQAASKRHANAGANAGANDMQLHTHFTLHTSQITDQNTQAPSLTDKPKPPSSSSMMDVLSVTGLLHFDAFWKSYPRKVGKRAAQKAWRKLKLDAECNKVLEAIARMKQSEQWKRDGGQYIPHPATFLNRGGQDDQPKVDRSTAGNVVRLCGCEGGLVGLGWDKKPCDCPLGDPFREQYARYAANGNN
jgi:uncharacterized protein YdaU (DUF1376 family)